MRFTNLATALVAAAASLSIGSLGCLGENGGDRKPGQKTDGGTSHGDSSCSKLEKDVTIRSAADMAALPKTGCYDIYGKLTIQGASVTSLAGLNALNSVDELELDHTALAAFDTKNDVAIYGKLTVTGNAKLANLKKLSFETAATGILIDNNAALASLDALNLDQPKLTEVAGDLAITGNPALAALPLKYLSRVTGGVTIANNAALKTVDVAALASVGDLEIADNAQLTSITGFAATTINGDLALTNNAALTTIGTLSALYRITGALTISGNTALTNLAAFTQSLKFVDQALTISNNANLTDLGQLKHLQLVGGITITNNANLSVCRATEIDRCTQHPTTAVITNNKNVNCNWQCN